MMNMNKILILIAAAIVLAGCIPPNANDIGDPKIALEYAKEFLPDKAKNLRPLGNQWILFDLEINGKTRTYMYQDCQPFGKHTTGSIVEVK